MNPTNPFPIAAADEHALDRRRFLCAAASAAALVLSGEWAANRRRFSSPGAPQVRLPDATTLAVGSAHAVPSADGGEVLAVRLDADTVVAYDRRCPHLGCPVVWAAARGRFECPCHHAAFDARTGRVLFGPPRRGLDPVKVTWA